MAKHQCTILSMMKDEGHSLVEWVAYHKHIGFDNICVYTNNCSDGTDDMLIRLEELGWVQHFRNDVPEGKKPQPNALTLATVNEEVTDSDWILTMDADEFLSVKVGRGRITCLIDRIDPAASAVAITWRFFGANGVTDWNPGLVIENYKRGAPDMFKKGWGVKTLFKPYRDMKLGIHRPHIKKAKQEPANAKLLFDQLWLNGSGNPMPDEFSLSGWRSTKPTLGYDMVELNHYGVKSYEAYLLRRVRGNVNNKEDKYNAAYFAMFDRNEEEHLNVERHARGTKKKMAQILSDPIMRDLQDKALAFHAARVEMLRSSGEYEQWIKDLKDASAVELDKLDEVLFVQHLPKEWQQKVKELQAAGVPDKKIAKMISQTQTAKKGETRQALLAAAGENAEEKLDAHQLKSKTSKGDSLDNPFMNTEAAAGLGVPLMKERTQKIALAAQAADPSDKASAKLIAKAAKAQKVKTSQTATVDLREAAPPIGDIVEAATLEASTNIESPPDTVPVPEVVKPKPKKTAKKPAPRKTPAKKPAPKKPAAKAPAKKTAAKAAPKPRAKTATKKATPQMSSAPNAGRKVLVSTMKNEGPYLLEWLAYHKSIGITDFCIFSNDCTDGTNLMLNRLDQMGVVKHFDNPLGPRMDPQRAAYSRANKTDWVKSADWVLIVDADEFLNIHVGDRTIDALIDACGNPDAISINWRLMGSQGQAKMTTDPFAGELVTERFTRGSSFDNPENGLVWGFKTLFRPDKFSFFGVHRPKFDKKIEITPGMVTWTNAAGQPMGEQYLQKGWRGNKTNVTDKFAQVNHYAIKSREDFLLKRLRGTANSKNKDRIDMDYWDKYDINSFEDTTIPTDGIRAQMDEWLQDNDLAALSRACADCSQRVLDYQLTVPEFRTFIDTGLFEPMKKDKDKEKNKE